VDRVLVYDSQGVAGFIENGKSGHNFVFNGAIVIRDAEILAPLAVFSNVRGHDVIVLESGLSTSGSSACGVFSYVISIRLDRPRDKPGVRRMEGLCDDRLSISYQQLNNSTSLNFVYKPSNRSLKLF
jgi:hypothetical protein